MKYHISYLLVMVLGTMLLLGAACTQVVQEAKNTSLAATTSSSPATAVATSPVAAVATPSTPAASTGTSFPAITKLTPPPGIGCFMADVTSRVDRTGAIFWNSQCKNNLGQLVFRTDSAGTKLAFATGQGGRGSLDVGPDGRLYITVNDLEQIHAFRLPVPGWQP